MIPVTREGNIVVAVIEASGVHKQYRRLRGQPQKALDGLELDVPEGGVHGFLGPNGSGKTTSIRALLGLVEVDAGSLSLLGRPVPGDLSAVIGDVGALVETPLFVPNFSGRLNLRILARTAGVPTARVEECLRLVGLADRANDRFKGYSLGMKQRLGIAAALLKSPRLLILDEPSNGLDPAGIKEVRELIRTLGADGRTTVLLCSHLLTEVQQVCDSVTVLARGRTVASGTVSEVFAGASHGALRLRVPDPVTAKSLLETAGLTVTSLGDAFRVEGAGDPSRVTRVLADGGVYLTELSPMAADLETAFLALTTQES